MVAIKLQQFGGMIPRLGDQTLPEGAASFAENALLLSGELRGVRGTQLVADFSFRSHDINRVYRVNTPHVTGWVLFPDETVDMVKAPLVNDAVDRYYWSSENHPPRYAPIQQLIDEETWVTPPGYVLGIPAPDHSQTPFTVTVSGGGTEDTVTRAYTYTYVSAYGEESAPALAVVETGPADATWTLSGLLVPDNTDRNLTQKHIYRTVTTTTGKVEYHYVDSIPLADTTYADTMDITDVALNNTLESQFFEEPPDDLIGLMTHPNGFLVGFHDREIYFSEPYRPHAWPKKYTLSVESPIRGLGVFGTSVAIATEAHPYTVTGIHPSAMTLIKAQTANPCISNRRGVVTMPFGVYFPTDTGLMLLSPAGFTNATQKLLTKSEWNREYTPASSDFEAVRWQSQYIAFHSTTEGFMFAPDEPQSAFVELRDYWNHDHLQNDENTGSVFLIRDKVILEWNPATGISEHYTWISKEYVTPEPVNFSAMAVEFGEEVEISQEALEEYQDYNDVRFAWPLNPFNWHAINTVRSLEERTSTANPQDPADHPSIGLQGFVPPPPYRDSHRQPFHASPLYKTSVSYHPSGDRNVVVKVFADDILVYEQAIQDEDQYRLPSGYKARRWKFELHGAVDIASLKIAETGKELASV